MLMFLQINRRDVKESFHLNNKLPRHEPLSCFICCCFCFFNDSINSTGGMKSDLDHFTCGLISDTDPIFYKAPSTRTVVFRPTFTSQKRDSRHSSAFNLVVMETQTNMKYIHLIMKSVSMNPSTSSSHCSWLWIRIHMHPCTDVEATAPQKSVAEINFSLCLLDLCFFFVFCCFFFSLKFAHNSDLISI